MGLPNATFKSLEISAKGLISRADVKAKIINNTNKGIRFFVQRDLINIPEQYLETAAQRAVSRLRRTNDRSVPGVISGDAEDASHVNGSYPSKQKYKLDSSSLHEDHEDDENVEIGVPLHAQDSS